MLILPDYVDREAWDGWVDMRQVMHKEKKAPWTPRVEKIAMRQLGQFHDQGYDCNYVLDEAVLKGWRGLFVDPQRTPKIKEFQPAWKQESMTYARVWFRLKEQRDEAMFRKDGVWAAGCTLAMRTLNERAA